jgi:putative ABC transport system ATP-binding protein
MSNSKQLDGTLVELRAAERSFAAAGGSFLALRAVSLSLRTGEFAAVVGGSGSGKSTLLNLITGIDRATAGEVWVADTPLHTLTEDDLARFRARHVGIVFQFFQLLPSLTALENVILPMDFVGVLSTAQRRDRAIQLLEQVGIREQANKFPDALSGGQQQRVAIARALANDPPLIVADEPTGNLDSHTAHEVLMLFSRLAREGKTILVVTHEKEHRSLFRKVFELADGQLVNAETASSRREVSACTD